MLLRRWPSTDGGDSAWIPKPNLVNPETHGPELIIFGVLGAALATVIVGLRMYVRLAMIRAFKSDDLFVVLALPPTIAFTAVSIKGMNRDWGIHQWDTLQEWRPHKLLLAFICELLFGFSVTLTKISILCSFIRISTSRRFTWFVGVTIAASAILYTVFAFLIVFHSNPISDTWNAPGKNGGGRYTSRQISLIASAVNFCIDIWIFLLPIPTLWTLQLPVRQRFILIGLMGLGGWACIAGALRLWYTNKAWQKSADTTWETYSIWLWANMESYTGIICATIPTLRPLVKIYLPNFLGNNDAGDGKRSPKGVRPSFVMSVDPMHNNNAAKPIGEETTIVTIGGRRYRNGKREWNTGGSGRTRESTMSLAYSDVLESEDLELGDACLRKAVGGPSPVQYSGEHRFPPRIANGDVGVAMGMEHGNGSEDQMVVRETPGVGKRKSTARRSPGSRAGGSGTEVVGGPVADGGRAGPTALARTLSSTNDGDDIIASMPYAHLAG